MATEPTPPAIDPLAHVPAWVCGAAGGFISALGQYIGNTLNETLDHCVRGEWTAAVINLIYFVTAAALTAFAGGMIAYFLQSWTRNRWMLFVSGIAATSIGTQALPGLQRLLLRADIAPISTAFAQSQSQAGCNDWSSFSLTRGLSQFFRLDNANYRVVVGSFKTLNDAQAQANKINAAEPSLRAFVGEKAPCNDFYPVIVGPPSTTLEEAKKIQDKVLSLDTISIPGAYISKRPY